MRFLINMLNEGIENIENLEVLKVQPINQLGTPFEIISIFGGKDKYLGGASWTGNANLYGRGLSIYENQTGFTGSTG